MTGVSFVVTVYNKAVFLPAVLGAIFAQEGDFAREFVFIDDGSRDDSVAVMERLCAGRADVRIIRQANAGPAKATNAAVKAATLPWLKIVDGDDVLAPSCTRTLLDAASRLGARFAVGRTVTNPDVTHVTFPVASAPPAIRKGDLFAECVRNAPCNLTPTLIDRALYWEVGGADARLFYVIDTALLMRASRGRAVAAVNALVAKGPLTAPNRMSADQARMLREHNRAMLYLRAENPNLSWRLRRQLLERAFGRAWKWQHRRRGASMASRWFWLYALAKFGPPSVTAPFLPSTLDAFTEALM